MASNKFMTISFWKLFKELIRGASSLHFFLGVLFSFSFSITVVLCTIGIMDGFDETLKKGLRKSSGDLIVFSREGFFDFRDSLDKSFRKNGIKNYAEVLETKGFAIYNKSSKGVVIKGVEPHRFKTVTDIGLDLKSEGVCLGKALGQNLGVSLGEEIVLVFASGFEGTFRSTSCQKV